MSTPRETQFAGFAQALWSELRTLYTEDWEFTDEMKEHDTQYQLPITWVRTLQYDKYGIEQEKHFCSKQCLVIWAQSLMEEAS